MTQEISDEKLMALADGELAPAEQADLRRRIADDPALAERFALYVETRALLRGEAADADTTTVPDRLVAAIRRAAEQPADGSPKLSVIAGGAEGKNLVLPAEGRARPRPARTMWQWPLAAAIAAFAIGGVIGHRFGQPSFGTLDPANADVAMLPGAKTAIAEGLATVPSGESRRWRDAASGLSGQFVMIATHRMTDGGTCREYEIAPDRQDMPRQTMVSCRRGGIWRTQIAIFLRPATDYAPAGGAHAAIEQMLIGLGSRAVVTGEEERQLLQGR